MVTTVARASFWKRVTGGRSDLEGSVAGRRTPPPFYADRARAHGRRARRVRRASALRSVHAPSPRPCPSPGSPSRSPASSSPRRLRRRARRRRPPASDSSPAAGARASRRDPGHRQRSRPSAPTGSCSRSSTRRRTCRPRPRTGRRRSRSSRPARPARAGRPADLRVGDRGLARRLRRDATFPAAGDWKAVFITAGAGGRRRRSASRSRCSTRRRRSRRPGGPASRPTRGRDVGGDLSKISTDTKPDPRFYQMSVADALAAHTPFVLVFATPAFCRSAQCGPTLDRVKAAAAAAPEDVAFINVEPYKLAVHRRPAPAGARRERPAPDGRRRRTQWGLVSEPWIFTVGAMASSRGRSRVSSATRAEGGDRADRGSSGSAAAPAERVLDPVHDEHGAGLAEEHANRRRCREVLRQVPRRELGAVLEHAEPERELGAVVGAQREAVTSVRPLASMSSSDPVDGRGGRRRPGSRRRGDDRRRSRAAGACRGVGPAAARATAQRRRPEAAGTRVTRGHPGPAAAGLDGRLAGGAARARPGPARTSAARAATARKRVAPPVDGESAWTGRRTGRRAPRTRRSRRPAASTAGIIASSEPPVVRMSSTRSTRSPARS